MFLAIRSLRREASDSESGFRTHYAFRIESDRVLLSIATKTEGQPVDIAVDYESLILPTEHEEAATDPLEIRKTKRKAHDTSDRRRSGGGQDWLVGEGWKRLRDAIDSLSDRHKIGNRSVAVSLSGDFCVTRISTGTIDHVDQELAALASRIPRYLQLGPGGKLIGQIRETLTPGVDHALTAVGNLTRLNALYDAFLDCEINVSWIEPSLVSMARLVGMFGMDQDHPILIADSFGQSWEVGISHQGRLLLDYRPAAAHDAETFALAIDEHLARLRRFCQRHRGMIHSDLGEFHIAGPPQKVDVVVNHFGSQKRLTAASFRLPDAFLNLRIPDEIRSDSVAAVAAVLPLIQQTVQQTPPDLLQNIRRGRTQSSWVRTGLALSPIAVVAIVLMMFSVWVGGLRIEFEQKRQQREFVQTQMQATQARMASLQSDRRWVEQLKRIETMTVAPPVVSLTQQMTHCLPPQAVLTSIRFDGDGNIMLVGKTGNEAEIYEIIGYLRRLSGIDQVALLGTTSGLVKEESQFEMRLSWHPTGSDSQSVHATQESMDE